MDGELEKVLKILTDDYAIKILVASYDKEKSAIQLSQELEVPIAACYRRIHLLQNAGFLQVSERINSKGKRIKYYNSLIKKASINIEDNRVLVEIVYKNGVVKKLSGSIVGKGYGK